MKNLFASIALVAVVFIACSKNTSEDTVEEAATTVSSSIIAEGAQLEKLGNGFQFTEGPAVDNQGNVYFTDQPNDRILRWSALRRCAYNFSGTCRTLQWNLLRPGWKPDCMR